MNRDGFLLLWLCLTFLLKGSPAEGAGIPTVLEHAGMCDASAGVMIGTEFFAAADDESNVLRVYSNARSGYPIRSFDMGAHLSLNPKTRRKESDIEGATRCGDVVYWITSHGRDKNGRLRPERCRFFASKTIVVSEGIELIPVGRAYSSLLRDLLADKRLAVLGFYDAVRPDRVKDPFLASQDVGLNIEGLCALKDDNGLLIGFRSPRPSGKSLLVPLANPSAVIEKGEAPLFGSPILLDLGGMGIRSIDYSRPLASYLIAAGSGSGLSTLFRWSGKETDRPVLLDKTTQELRGSVSFNPEAILSDPDRNQILLLSDDGRKTVNDGRQSFRSTVLTIE